MDQWEDLERRVAALEAAAAPAPQPEPPDDRLTFLANWIVGFVGSALTRDHAESLARALLTRPETQRVLTGTRVAASSESTLAPMAWPELPEEPQLVVEYPDETRDFIAGWENGWAAARERLAAMNPNRQEGVSRG